LDFNKFKEIIYEEVNNRIIIPSFEEKENGSFSELMFNKLSTQSVNIKMGNVLEESWKKFISLSEGVQLENKRKIEDSQIDILFWFDNVYYFECKNNINLDTEKSIATFNKIKKIEKFLKKDNDNVISKVLVNRYNTTANMKFYKTPLTKEDLYGYNDVFNIFGINVLKEEWESFFKDVGNYILKGS
jgi:hypothetical protein